MTVGFLLALGLGELGIALFDDQLPDPATFPTPEGQVKYTDLVVEGRDVGVVALGSSSLEAALDPDQLSSSIDAYNLAMPFTDLATMRLWLSEVVFKHAHPELVLIGLPLWESPNPVSISEATSAALRRRSRNPYPRILARHGSLAVLDQWIARDQLMRANLWTAKGHQTAYYHDSAPVDEWPTLRSAVLTDEELVALQSLIGLIRRQDAEPVIIIEPVAITHIDESEETKRYLDMLRDVAGRLGVRFWNLPVAFGDSALYVDGLHMTREGASLFSLQLADRLQSITVGAG